MSDFNLLKPHCVPPRHVRDEASKFEEDTRPMLIKSVTSWYKTALVKMFETFESFRPHFNALARAGYFKMVLRSAPKWKYSMHYFYRVLVWIGIISYNTQLIIRSFQTLHCTKRLLETLFILLTTLNALGKQVAFNMRATRLDNIVNIINGEYFASKEIRHESIIKANANAMSLLLKAYQAGVLICGVSFTAHPLINKAIGEEADVAGYFPFDTSEAPVFQIAALYMGVLISLQAYGHVTMDCTIVSFYAQARAQFQIFKYNMEHLVDEFVTETSTDRPYRHFDENESVRAALQKKFVGCVQHYEQIVWFAKEVESIFSEAMIVQFFVIVWVICMTVYKIVGLSVLSAEFISMVLYLGCMLAQLFIYCYYGTHLKVESEIVNDSVYACEWVSLSPAFRRQLFILMERCKRSVEPCIAYVVPMSLETYISVLRSSYGLFTILNTK